MDRFERDIERDLEKINEKNAERDSLKVKDMPEKEIISISIKLLDKDDDRKEIKISQTEKYVLERYEVLLKKETKKNNQEIAKNINNIKDSSKDESKNNGKNIQKIMSLNERNSELNERQNKINDILYPERNSEIKTKTLKTIFDLKEKENSKDFNERMEKNVLYIDNEKQIYLKEETISKVISNPKQAVSTILDVCKYKAFSEGKIPGETRKEISSLGIKVLSKEDRIVPKEELEKIVLSKNPSAIRDFYEFGLRIDNEKAQPLQINNVCKILENIPRANEYGRIEVINKFLQNKIPNEKLNEKSITNFSEKFASLGEEKYSLKIDLLEKKATVQSKISPEELFLKENREISLQKTNEEKFANIIGREKDSLKEIDKKEMTQIELKNILLSNDPRLLLEYKSIGLELPDNLSIDSRNFEKCCELTKNLKDNDKYLKLAIFSSAIKDETEKDFLKIGEKEDRPFIKEILEKKMDISKDINENIKTLLSKNNLEKIEKEPNIRAIDIYNPKEAISLISKYVGTICSKDNYSRELLKETLKEIKNKKIDFKSVDISERSLRDSDLIKISKTDPAILLDIQRLGINIVRNGQINDEKLKKTIDVMSQIPKENDVARLGVLSSCLVGEKSQQLFIKNSINMMDSKKNDDIKKIAIQLESERRGILNNSKIDDKLNKNLEIIKKAVSKSILLEKERIYEKEHVEKIKSTLLKNEEIKNSANAISNLLIADSFGKEKNEKAISLIENIRENEIINISKENIHIILFSRNYEKALKNLSLKMEEKNFKVNFDISNRHLILDSKDIEKISKISSLIDYNEKSLFHKCINADGSFEKFDAIKRFVILSSIAPKETEQIYLPYLLNEEISSKLKSEINIFKEYIEKTCGNENVLDKNVSEKIVIDYFNNKLYERLDIQNKELLKNNVNEINNIQQLDEMKLTGDEKFYAKSIILNKTGILNKTILEHNNLSFITKEEKDIANNEFLKLTKLLEKQKSEEKNINNITENIKCFNKIYKEILPEIKDAVQKDLLNNEIFLESSKNLITKEISVNSKVVNIEITSASSFNTVFEKFSKELSASSLNYKIIFPNEPYVSKDTFRNANLIQITNANIYSLSSINSDLKDFILEKVDMNILKDKSIESASVSLMDNFIKTYSLKENEIQKIKDSVMKRSETIDIKLMAEYCIQRNTIALFEKMIYDNLSKDINNNAISKEIENIIKQDFNSYIQDFNERYSDINKIYNEYFYKSGFESTKEGYSDFEKELEKGNYENPFLSDKIKYEDGSVPEERMYEKDEEYYSNLMDLDAINERFKELELFHETIRTATTDDLKEHYFSNVTKIEDMLAKDFSKADELREYYEKIKAEEDKINKNFHNLSGMHSVEILYDFKEDSVIAIDFSDNNIIYKYDGIHDPMVDFDRISGLQFIESQYDNIANYYYNFVKNEKNNTKNLLEEKIKDSKIDMRNTNLMEQRKEEIEYRLFSQENLTQTDREDVEKFQESLAYYYMYQEELRELENTQKNLLSTILTDDVMSITEEQLNEILYNL